MIEIESTGCRDAVAELLPWYVNETLDETERDEVREHISTCEDCRDNVELLSQVQQAVRTESPAPLVPAPRTEDLLAALDGAGRSHLPGNRRQWLAAAAVIAMIGVASILVFQRDGSIESPVRFETATSAPAAAAINYVVELQFADGVGAQDRMAVFAALEASDTVRPIDSGAYRVTLALGSLSLTDLENFVQDIEARPEVSSAEVVAVQLPVE
ncbi:MAG: anti-sigma factor family protein [Woeseiaceae bacterium]